MLFFKSRSGVSNKEKSAGAAYFLRCVWSSPAASHHARFDSAAVSPVGGKMPSKQEEQVSRRFSNIYFAINWVFLKKKNIYCD